MERDRFVFPDILKKAVCGLDHDVRWGIIEYLSENGETSYSTLLKELKINNKGKLTFHLRALSRSSLIDRYEILGGPREKSYYDVSPIGKNIINGLMSALTPHPRKEDSPWRAMTITKPDLQPAMSKYLEVFKQEPTSAHRHNLDTYIETIASYLEMAKPEPQSKLYEVVREDTGSSVDTNPYYGKRKEQVTPFIKSR